MPNQSLKAQLQAQARELGYKAGHQHLEGVDIAIQQLNDALAEIPRGQKKQFHINVRPYPCNEQGMGNIVSYIIDQDGDMPLIECEIIVATMPDRVQVISDGTATPVGYTTKAMMIVKDTDGSEFAAVVWQKSTTEVIDTEMGIEDFLKSASKGAL